MSTTLNFNVVRYVTILMFSSFLFYVSTGLEPLAGFIILALIPLLYLAIVSPIIPVLGISFMAYFVGGLNMYEYLTIHVPVTVILLSMIFQAIIFSCCALCFKFLHVKYKAHSTWMTAALWVSSEFIISLLSPHGTFGNLAYSQSDIIPLVQISSITGLWGVSFVVFLLAGLLAAFIESKRPVILFLIGMVLAFIAINHQLLKPKENDDSLVVGMVTMDHHLGLYKTTVLSEILVVTEDYLQIAGDLVGQGAQVILFPEKIVTLVGKHVERVKNLFKKFSEKSGTILIVGVAVRNDEFTQNQAWIFDHGELKIEYTKQHLVPGWEAGYVSGTEIKEFNIVSFKSGVAICKDLDFPKTISQYASSTILWVPAWDFKIDAMLHANMAQFRAVENGFTMVRAASEGLMSVYYPSGIQYEKPSGDLASQSFILDVNPQSYSTIYQKFGDWFAYLCLLLAAFSLMLLTKCSVKNICYDLK